MLHTIAIHGYRSLRDVVLPLRRLTLVTGANGTGKSSLYRALRLLADCGRGEVIGSLAREGGLDSVLWAGPEHLGRARRTGRVEGTTRTAPVALELGFSSDDFGDLVDLGIPQIAGIRSLFTLDPEIKREVVFAGAVMRRGSTLPRYHARRRRRRRQRRHRDPALQGNRRDADRRSGHAHGPAVGLGVSASRDRSGRAAAHG